MLFLIHKKTVNKNCIFYQRLLPHTFLGPTIRCVPETSRLTSSHVRHIDILVASCGEMLKSS
jgi:hypothetical protein